MSAEERVPTGELGIEQALRARGGRVARAVLTGVEGGSARRLGAALWVAADGSTWGGITIGGCIEGWVAARAREALEAGVPARLRVALGGEGAIDPRLGCAGEAEIQVEVVDFADPRDPVVAAYGAIRRECDAGRAAVAALSPGGARAVVAAYAPDVSLPPAHRERIADAIPAEVVVAPREVIADALLPPEVAAGRKMLANAILPAEVAAAPREVNADTLLPREVAAGREVLANVILPPEVAAAAREKMADTLLPAGVAAAAREMIADGAPRARVAEGWLLELFRPAPLLLVFGAGPVAVPLAAFAAAAGFRVWVVDGNAELLTDARFPAAERRIALHPHYAVDTLPWEADSYAVVTSHNPADEVPVLARAVRTEAAFVGFVGSRERGARVLRFLVESGVPEELLARVRVPVGLEVGAETPAEIAVSILAELVAVRNSRPRAAAPGEAAPRAAVHPVAAV